MGDIAYPPVGNGQFVYPGPALDLYPTRLAGWSFADHMRTELVTDALRAAAPPAGASGLNGAFHSDNGQYALNEFTQVCGQLGVTRSRGTSADNAAAESLNWTMKRETLQGANRWLDPARLAVSHRYNARGRHSSLGQLSPIAYEQRPTMLALPRCPRFQGQAPAS